MPTLQQYMLLCKLLRQQFTCLFWHRVKAKEQRANIRPRAVLRIYVLLDLLHRHWLSFHFIPLLYWALRCLLRQSAQGCKSITVHFYTVYCIKSYMFSNLQLDSCILACSCYFASWKAESLTEWTASWKKKKHSGHKAIDLLPGNNLWQSESCTSGRRWPSVSC